MELFNRLQQSLAATSPDARILLAFTALGLAFLLYITSRVLFWRKQGRLMKTTPGHVTPRITWPARLARYLGARLYVRFKVGWFKLYGAENLNVDGRLMIMINHQDERDAVVIPSILGTLYFRALMAINQIYGWRQPVAAWLGIIPVHHDRDPSAAAKATIRALKMEAKKRSSGLAFPQGELIRDNVLRRNQWFAGATMICLSAAKDSEDPFYALPIYVEYDRDPKNASYVVRFFRWLSRIPVIGWPFRWVGLGSLGVWFGNATSGVTVVIGKPIAVPKRDTPKDAEGFLPKDRDKAMDVIFDAVVGLKKWLDDERAKSTPGNNKAA